MLDSLSNHHVVLVSMVLKTDVVLSGKHWRQEAGVDEVAAATLRWRRRAMPAPEATLHHHAEYNGLAVQGSYAE